MTFPRIRPPGEWVGTIDSAELDQFDQNLSRALDGHGGGTYAPSTQLVIGGAGFKVSGIFQVTSTAQFTNGVTVNGSSGFTGNTGFVNLSGWAIEVLAGGASIAGNSKFLNDLSIDGTLGVLGATALAGGLVVGGGSVLGGNTVFTDGDVTVNGAATFNEPVGFNDGVIFGGSVVAAKEVILSGEGRVRKRVINAPNNNASLSVLDADVIAFVANPIMTSGWTFNITNDGASDGSEIELVYVIQIGSAVTIIASGANMGSIAPGRRMLLRFMGGVWTRVAWHSIDVELS